MTIKYNEFTKYFRMDNNIDFNPQRFFGGKFEHEFQPFTSGYYLVLFELPTSIFPDPLSITKLLFSTCTNVNEPSRNIEKTEIPGIGGQKINIITKQTYDQSLSLSFIETNNLIYNVFKTWCSFIIPITGTTFKKSLKQIDYKGNLLVVTLKPSFGNNNKKIKKFTKNDVLRSNYYQGIIPLVEYGGGSNDIESNEKLSIETSFTFDGYPIGDNDFAIDYLNLIGIKLDIIKERIYKNFPNCYKNQFYK